MDDLKMTRENKFDLLDNIKLVWITSVSTNRRFSFTQPSGGNSGNYFQYDGWACFKINSPQYRGELILNVTDLSVGDYGYDLMYEFILRGKIFFIRLTNRDDNLYSPKIMQKIERDNDDIIESLSRLLDIDFYDFIKIVEDELYDLAIDQVYNEWVSEYDD